MGAHLDLGHLDLESASCGLHLCLRSAARIAPSGKDDLDQLRTRLTEYELSGDRERLPYMSGGTNTVLTIRLQVESELQDEMSAQETVRILSLRLRDLKLWPILGLSSPCVQTSDDEGLGHYIVLLLRNTERSSDQPQRRIHKLGTDVPNRDIRPPNGMAQATIDSIELSITLSMSRVERSRSQHDGNEAPYALSATTAEALDDELLLEGWADDDDFNELLLDDEQNVLDDLTTDPAHDGLVRHGANTAPPSESSEIGHSDTDILRCDVSELIVSCVHAAIAGRPRRCAPGTAMSTEHLLSLSVLAPSIWSPGYHATVAERSVFLPTISHAFSTVLCTTQRHSLVRMVDKIVNVRRSSNSNIDDISERAAKPRNPGRLSDITHERLWKIMEVRVKDTRIAKSLSIPPTPVMAAYVESVAATDILELNEDDSIFEDRDESGGFVSDNDEDLLFDDLLVNVDFAAATASDKEDIILHLEEPNAAFAGEDLARVQRLLSPIMMTAGAHQNTWPDEGVQMTSTETPTCFV